MRGASERLREATQPSGRALQGTDEQGSAPARRAGLCGPGRGGPRGLQPRLRALHRQPGLGVPTRPRCVWQDLKVTSPSKESEEPVQSDTRGRE